jgi:hypothetical protein
LKARSGTSPSSKAIRKACQRISTKDLLRVDGDFGTFYGYASSIGPEGLGGLRVEVSRASVPSPGSVGWDRIERIEVRGGNAGRGAARGAAGFGLLAGLLGLPIGALASDSNGSSMAGIVVACAAVGAGIGMVLGGAGGAMSSGWHLAYQRR